MVRANRDQTLRGDPSRHELCRHVRCIVNTESQHLPLRTWASGISGGPDECGRPSQESQYPGNRLRQVLVVSRQLGLPLIVTQSRPYAEGCCIAPSQGPPQPEGAAAPWLVKRTVRGAATRRDRVAARDVREQRHLDQHCQLYGRTNPATSGADALPRSTPTSIYFSRRARAAPHGAPRLGRSSREPALPIPPDARGGSVLESDPECHTDP